MLDVDDTTQRLRAAQINRFGANVRAARLARGWTQEDLAGQTKLAVVQISRIERGVREIRLTTLIRLIVNRNRKGRQF